MKGHDLATIFDSLGAPGGPTVWRRPNATGIPRFLLGVRLADPGRANSLRTGEVARAHLMSMPITL